MPLAKQTVTAPADSCCEFTCDIQTGATKEVHILGRVPSHVQVCKMGTVSSFNSLEKARSTDTQSHFLCPSIRPLRVKFGGDSHEPVQSTPKIQSQFQ
jgi:hypothetical protein